MDSSNRWLWYIFGIMFLGVLILKGLTLYTDYLWFLSLEQGEVFSTIFWTKIGLGVVFGGIFFGWLYINLRHARRPLPKDVTFIGKRLLPDEEREQIEQYADRSLLIFALVGALMAGVMASARWIEWLQFTNAVPFGDTDTVFGIDIGFYVFKLRFIEYIWRSIYHALIATVVVSVLVHLYQEAIRVVGNTVNAIPYARTHVLGLLAATLFVKIYGYRLDQFNLLYSNRAGVFAGGPGWTDIHCRLPVLGILMVVAAITGIIVLVSIKSQSYKLPAGALATLILVSALGGTVYPAAMQKLVVIPNQLDKERPFIESNIAATNRAYGLDNVRNSRFKVSAELNADDIANNRATIENIRIWDHRPLQRTYNQTQAIRAYYNFPDVDVDRYMVDGRVRQVMLAARQLNASKLPAQNWVSTHLKYTHGFGVAMSPANEVRSPNGQPNFWVSGIPPTTTIGLDITRPGIYYGASIHPRMIERISPMEQPLSTQAENPAEEEEPAPGPGGGQPRQGPNQARRGYGDQPADVSAEQFVLVNTKEKELDYSRGGQSGSAVDNAYTHYSGRGGVRVNSFFTRVAFFARFFPDVQILFTNLITDQSRIQINRTLPERMQAIAPFMMYDPDPYLVVNEDGTLKWILDAYTISSKYPYAQGIPRLGNYVRNSVKVVCDAYDGIPEYYIGDDSDPLVQCYAKIFPTLFKSKSEMSPYMRSHLRYPQLMFMLQVQIYNMYHMKDPEVFFQGEDRWAIPPEIYSFGRRMVEAYYVVMELPGEDEPEFLLMMPLVLYGQEERNMVAWMAARCDGDNYGELIVYEFPRGQFFDGPWQVESRITQDAEISKAITLWDTQGSHVIRGNLLVIPLADSILYVEPLYLEAEDTGLPELRRVIVVYGEQVEWAPTLEGALANLFGDMSVGHPRASVTSAPISVGGELSKDALQSVRQTVARLLALDREKQVALSAGDLATYQAKNKEQSALLSRLQFQVQ